MLVTYMNLEVQQHYFLMAQLHSITATNLPFFFHRPEFTEKNHGIFCWLQIVRFLHVFPMLQSANDKKHPATAGALCFKKSPDQFFGGLHID